MVLTTQFTIWPSDLSEPYGLCLWMFICVDICFCFLFCFVIIILFLCKYLIVIGLYVLFSFL